MKDLLKAVECLLRTLEKAPIDDDRERVSLGSIGIVAATVGPYGG